MRLYTLIPARKDGTVRVLGLDGVTTVFERDADGELCGDVTHAATLAFLLERGMFFPADSADYDDAISLTVVPDDDVDDEDGDDAALPIEENTPRVPVKRGRKPGPKPHAE